MSEVAVQTEQINDIPLLVQQQKMMGIAEVIDGIVRRHGNRNGLSLGWMLVGWLSYILSESDHRLSFVEEWAADQLQTLNKLLPGRVTAQDFSDDRLGEALRWLSQEVVWTQLENQLSQRLLRVYPLPERTARVDTTTVSLYHDQETSELFAHGHSKDHRVTLRPILCQSFTGKMYHPITDKMCHLLTGKMCHYRQAFLRQLSFRRKMKRSRRRHGRKKERNCGHICTLTAYASRG